MPHLAQIPQELALDEHTSHRNDLVVLLVDDDERVVGVGEAALGVKGGLPSGETGIGCRGEDGENFDVRAVVVCAS